MCCLLGLLPQQVAVFHFKKVKLESVMLCKEESGADVFGFVAQECSSCLPVQWSSRRHVWYVRTGHDKWPRGPVKTAL